MVIIIYIGLWLGLKLIQMTANNIMKIQSIKNLFNGLQIFLAAQEYSAKNMNLYTQSKVAKATRSTCFLNNNMPTISGFRLTFLAWQSSAVLLSLILTRFLNIQWLYSFGAPFMQSALVTVQQKKKVITGLRGPFVHKKAQERIKFRWYRASVFVTFLSSSVQKKFTKAWGLRSVTQFYLLQTLISNWWKSYFFAAARCAGLQGMRVIC